MLVRRLAEGMTACEMAGTGRKTEIGSSMPNPGARNSFSWKVLFLTEGSKKLPHGYGGPSRKPAQAVKVFDSSYRRRTRIPSTNLNGRVSLSGAVPTIASLLLLFMAGYAHSQPLRDQALAVTAGAAGLATREPAGWSLGRSTIIALPSAFPGLDPTGATDSTKALQTALNAAAGKRLILPQGNYTVTSLILPTRGIKIYAVGAKLTLAADSTDGEPILSIPYHSSNIGVDGVEIDGGASSSARSKRISGIVSYGHVSNILISDTYLHDIPLSAVQLSNGDTRWEVAGNRIERIGRHGIAVDYLTEQARDLTFHDNHISYCADSPITIIAGNGEGGSRHPNDTASAGARNVAIFRNYVIPHLAEDDSRQTAQPPASVNPQVALTGMWYQSQWP